MTPNDRIQEEFSKLFMPWGITLPANAFLTHHPGELRTQGWFIRYVFGADQRGEYLDYYASHRMTSDAHNRIYADGTVQHLETIQEFFEVPQHGGKEAESRAEQEYFAHNRRVGEILEQKGLLHSTGTTSLLYRAQGCLLGQVAGDALGSMVEFSGAASIQTRYPDGLREIGPSPVWKTLAGQPTDDSELALALARTLLKTGYDIEAAAEAYVQWLESPPFDIGNTTSRALSAALAARNQGKSMSAASIGAADRNSQANGALMRQSPMAIWGHHLEPSVLDQFVRADTVLTHPSIVCQDASAAFIVALAATIRDGLSGGEAYQVACEWNVRNGASPSITQALEQAANSKPNYEHHMGHVLIALQNAFYQAIHAQSFEEGVVDTVMGGGDTDTNAAIAGSLLGAIFGIPAIPMQWRDTVLSCRPATGTPGVYRPRPTAYWPVDLLELAEQLLSGAQP